jgi:hypothetical protein
LSGFPVTKVTVALSVIDPMTAFCEEATQPTINIFKPNQEGKLQ